MTVDNRIDGALLAEMVRGGAVNLRNNAVTVNELNVFPIPDGDTGENMARTVEGGAAASENRGGDISAVAEDVARGMLLSARGNSGVILSQFFEGLSKGLAGEKNAGVRQLKVAFDAGVKQAYAAVVKPTEGTILTVMREATEKAASVADDAGCERYFSVFIDEMYASLDRTPELLPVLKESGVIDSGGAGFTYIIEGMNAVLRGESAPSALPAEESAAAASTEPAGDRFGADSEMKYGYCTEVTVQLTNAKTDAEAFGVQTVVDYLQSIGGESVVAFKTGTRIKLHVHTFAPDKVLAYALTIGELIAVKVENMAVQHTETVIRNRFERRKPAEKRRNKYACVAVADGDGLTEQFRSLGADYVVDGKQTMNPSASDFLTAFDEVDAEVIFVLPDNDNIMLTAKQAAELYKKSRVIVIESKTLDEGYAALSMHDYSSDDINVIVGDMVEAIKGVSTGLVTYSVRDCSVGGRHIGKGDWMGFDGSALVAVSPDLSEAACGLIDGIDKSDKSIMIVACGKGSASEDVEKLARYVKSKYPDIEFYSFDGGQDVYPYIFIVE